MSISALDARQVALLVDASMHTREKARDRAILCLCIDAGARRREVPVLSVGDVDAEEGTVAVGANPCRRRVRIGATTLAALQPFVEGRDPTDPLLVDRMAVPVTDRVVHEQLRRMGELAGLGEWVTARHTRRTYILGVSRHLTVPVVLRLAGHEGDRVRPASIENAVRAQFTRPWVSPLEVCLSESTCQLAA